MFRFFIRGGDGQPHQVLIYDVIGAYFWEDSITAKMILSALSEIDDNDEILVRINCRGGDHEDGTAIYNALASHPGQVTIRVEGYACSMATCVLCAGDKVEMYETALLMLHRASTCVCGNSKEMLAAAEMLEKADQSIATAYARKTGKTKEEVLALIDEKGDTWLTPEEAQELGMVDEIIVPQKYTALLDRGAVTALGEDEGAAILAGLQPLADLPTPPTVKAALEGVPGVMAYRVDGKKIEPIKAASEHKPSDEPDPPPAEGQPGGESPEGDPPAGNPPEGDKPSGNEPPRADPPETEEGAPPADPLPDPIQAERERVKAIRAQAKACGVPLDDDLVEQLIDEGVKAELAGKMLLAVKRSAQNATSIRSNHHSEQPIGGAEQVQASWSNAYKNLPGRR